MRLINGIWGWRHNQTIDFYGTPNETEEEFKNNLNLMPADWPYRTKKITYQFNSLGHRAVEPDTLSDGYLLFGGCSHTEGVGLAVEDTYPAFISRQLGIDYYNIAQGGTGPDVLSHNIIMFVTMLKVKPACVIIQWPEIERFFTVSVVNHEMRGDLHNTSSLGRDPILKFSLENEIFSGLNNYYKIFLLEFLQNLNIPVVIASRHFPERPDLARDLLHFGILSNQKAAEILLPTIKRTLKI